MWNAYQKRQEELVHLDNFLLHVLTCSLFHFPSRVLCTFWPDDLRQNYVPNLQLPLSIRKICEMHCALLSWESEVCPFIHIQPFTSMNTHTEVKRKVQCKVNQSDITCQMEKRFLVPFSTPLLTFMCSQNTHQHSGLNSEIM